MKQIWILCLAGLLTFGFTAGAVDVKEKDTAQVAKPKVVDPKAKPAVRPAPAKNAQQPAKGSNVKPAEKKYDDFIDNNHNGIDDRKENLVKKDEK